MTTARLRALATILALGGTAAAPWGAIAADSGTIIIGNETTTESTTQAASTTAESLATETVAPVPAIPPNPETSASPVPDNPPAAAAAADMTVQPAPQPAATREAPPTQAEADAIELAFWETVRDSNDPQFYQAYLDRYPDGNFAVLAQLKLAALTAAAPAPAEAQPDAAPEPAAPEPAEAEPAETETPAPDAVVQDAPATEDPAAEAPVTAATDPEPEPEPEPEQPAADTAPTGMATHAEDGAPPTTASAEPEPAPSTAAPAPTTPSKPGPPPLSAYIIDKNYESMVVTANSNVREGPSTDYPIIGKLSRGMAVQSAGKIQGRNWYLVSNNAGVTGFIYGELVRRDGSSATAAAAPPSTGAAPDGSRQRQPDTRGESHGDTSFGGFLRSMRNDFGKLF